MNICLVYQLHWSTGGMEQVAFLDKAALFFFPKLTLFIGHVVKTSVFPVFMAWFVISLLFFFIYSCSCCLKVRTTPAACSVAHMFSIVSYISTVYLSELYWGFSSSLGWQKWSPADAGFSRPSTKPFLLKGFWCGEKVGSSNMDKCKSHI